MILQEKVNLHRFRFVSSICLWLNKNTNTKKLIEKTADTAHQKNLDIKRFRNYYKINNAHRIYVQIDDKRKHITGG